MAFTDPELVALRAEIPWSPPTDADLHAAHDRLGGFWAVARFYLRAAHSALLNPTGQPITFTIPGEYGENRTEQLKALERRLAEVEGLALEESAGGGPSTGRLVRVGRGRAPGPGLRPSGARRA